MTPISWESDRKRALEFVARPSPLKILLKTRDDPFFLERWITHHSKIVPNSDLIIFDNHSTDERVLETYERYADIPVFTFTGIHTILHDWEMQHDLYIALQSSQHHCFLDTDEFLGAIVNDRWVADPTLLSLLKPDESVPVTWLHNAIGSENIFAVRDSMEKGLLWGKPILARTPPKAGVLGHNVQFDPKVFENSTLHNFFLLHLINLDRDQRIRANLNKLKARGRVPQDTTVEMVREMSADDNDSYNVKLYFSELQKLLTSEYPAPPDEPKPGQLKIQSDLTIKYGAPLAQDTMRRHLSCPPTLYERLADGHKQGIDSGHVLPLKTPKAPPASDSFPSSMTKAEQDVYLSALEQSRHVIEFGVGSPTFMAVSSPAHTITSVDSDVNQILKIRRDNKISEAEASGRLSLRWADIGPVQDWGHPHGEQYRFKWSLYPSSFWLRPFDLALIDGRFRVACAVQGALNGCPMVLFHDFWDRPYYHDVLEIFDVKQKVDTLAALTPKPSFDRAAALNLYENYKNNPN